MTHVLNAYNNVCHRIDKMTVAVNSSNSSSVMVVVEWLAPTQHLHCSHM